MSLKDYPYTIEDIASYCKVTKQSIYNLIRANKEFIDQNSRKYQRRIVYNKAALQYFTQYYQVDGPTLDSTDDTIKHEESTTAPNIDGLQAQIKLLQAEIDTLRHQLEDKEIERKELLKQNGALILTLQQEKQEKQLYLPAPKKTITERIKGLFSKE